MQSSKHPRRGAGRYAAAALAAAAAAAVLGGGGTAWAASTSAASVPVTRITLSSDWSGSAGFGSSAPEWFVDNSLVDPAVVHLQGAVRQVSTSGPNSNLIGTLPQAARPDRSVYELVHTFNGTYADIEINQFGDIFLFDPHSPAVQDFSFVSLEGISYERDISKVNFPVTVNAANWSGHAGLDSATPSAWEDGSQFVHLQGAVTQTSAHGAGADVIGTLVGADRPAFNVFTIAHTFDGTYVDLDISASSGQITLIGARGPAVEDYRFVSLEGITFSAQGGEPTPITVNTANFTGHTVFGTVRPEADLDAFGVVHLSGAVARTSGTGTHANLVATVPGFARPHRFVYQIVHTNFGTYADVVITPAGQINLIDPRSPMVTDTSFVSLEGISYQP